MSRLVAEEPISSLFPFNIASSIVYKLDEGLTDFASHLFTHSPDTLGPFQWQLDELEAMGCAPPAMLKSFRGFDLSMGADFPALGMFGAPRIIGFAGARPALDVDELESLSVLMFQLHARLTVIGNARTEKKAPLTSLEREILSLASDGESFETISAHMELSSRTINYLVDSICKKMEVATVEHAVALTLRRRLAS
ncbi:helix-turn-helix transcriptional regulator [Agrobacterium sp. CG674]